MSTAKHILNNRPVRKPKRTFQLSDDLEIANLTTDDLADIMEIEHVSFPTPWSRELFIRELNSAHSLCFFVRKKMDDISFPIAYTCLWMIRSDIHITNVAVHPFYRRQKIASKLIRFIMLIAGMKKIRAAYLEVRRSNIPARVLYEKFGFKTIKIKRGYYSDTGEDALVMKKSINN